MKQEIAFLICMFDISEVNKIFRTTEQRLIYLHKYQFHQFGKKRCMNEIDLERWLWWLIIMEKLIFKLLQMHLYINIEYYCWFILLYAIQLYSNISKIYSTCDKLKKIPCLYILMIKKKNFIERSITRILGFIFQI